MLAVNVVVTVKKVNSISALLHMKFITKDKVEINIGEMEIITGNTLSTNTEKLFFDTAFEVQQCPQCKGEGKVKVIT